MASKPLTQPLVTRPAYGQRENPALPDGEGRVAESGLPEGSPASKGVSLNKDIPGSKTFVKPEGAGVREFDKGEEESIYRTENADDQLTIQNRVNIRDDNANKHDGIGYNGKGETDERSPKTKYPNRDGLRHQHNASSVVERFLAESAHSLRIPPKGKVKIALNLGGITNGLNQKVVDRSKRCVVATKRADIKNLRWILTVNCGNGAKVVKLKGVRNGAITKLSKMDLDLSCSCNAWRWLGSEHHSKREDYLDGKPRGTASVPVIKDPKGINRVCKHVYAVTQHVQNWDVARKKR